jgi:hypothetical protein
MTEKWRLCFFILVGMRSSCVYDNLNTVTVCNLENISYAKQVQPIITARCAKPTCHATSHPSLLTISNYKWVIQDSSDIKMFLLNGYMPKGKPLTDCELKTISEWLNQGGIGN